MSLVMRVVLLVGVLAYFATTHAPDTHTAAPKPHRQPQRPSLPERPASLSPDKLADLSRAWNALPEPVRQKALEAIRAEFDASFDLPSSFGEETRRR